MNKNDYYSKYLKYKMKYLHKKQMQIGGLEITIQINMLKENLKTTFELVIDTSFQLVIDTSKNVDDIKKRIFIQKNIPVDKQRLIYNKKELIDDQPITSFFPKPSHLGITIILILKQ